MTNEEVFDQMTMIANLTIGIMERGVAFDEALERAVRYHVAAMRGEEV